MDPIVWNHKIFNESPGDFASLALEIFRKQAVQTGVYREFLAALQVSEDRVFSLEQVPFLPVRFFRQREVIGEGLKAEKVFESSGTTGMQPSRHFVASTAIYEESFLSGFRMFYGAPSEWCILALLPSYLERKNSSLVYMAERLIQESGHPQSGFYLGDLEKLATALTGLEREKTKTLLLGVSFALLDLADRFPMRLHHTIVMETGGMKGRREEMIREELHQHLKEAFGLGVIHSEYGMTELLSQAYSAGNGIFRCPPWMKVVLRDEEDPFRLHFAGAYDRAVSGAINVIDLANVHSCSFIATDDVGRLHPDGSFEVLGRMDGSDLRGCSLMVV